MSRKGRRAAPEPTASLTSIPEAAAAVQDPAATGQGDASRGLASGQGMAGQAARSWTPDGDKPACRLDLSADERRVRDLVAPAFDGAYYMMTNQDVCDAGVDPLDHYVRSGRLEDRWPARWFDPVFYRGSCPDPGLSGQDPLSHYMCTGRAEGAPTSRVNRPARHALARALPPSDHRPGGQVDTVRHLHPDLLGDRLRGRLPDAEGLVVSVSHDQYLRSVGGIQNLIASEQAAFNARGNAYLHVAPAAPLMTLAPDNPGPDWVEVTLDGAHLGATTAGELAAALDALAPDLPRRRQLVVHCLFGHGVRAVAALHEALRHPAAGLPDAVFWVHDYHTVCPGYALLRNDAAFCGAPPADSLACGVCVYGEERPAHLAAVRALFGAVPFRVAAPSHAALALWLRHADLPHRSAEVVDILRTEPTAVRRRIGGAPERGSPGLPVRVAFAGHPASHKGWDGFRRIAAELARSGFYRLLHLSASGDQRVEGVEHVPVRVSQDAPDAMTSALAAAGVDLVLVLSPWPETFCIVAAEAMAAGADVLALAGSGNVASLVRRTGRGRVFDTLSDLSAFLTSPEAVRYVRARHHAGMDVGRTRLLGGTAAMPDPPPMPENDSPSRPAPAKVPAGTPPNASLDASPDTSPDTSMRIGLMADPA